MSDDSRRGSRADKVWRTMSALVLDNRENWRRAAMEQAGIPFSRIRILRRLATTSMTVKGLANAATLDAPAATVAVNDLESRGFVVRQPDPTNRRSKLVSLTESGRAVVRGLDEIDDPAPAVFAVLDDNEIEALGAILDKLGGG